MKYSKLAKLYSELENTSKTLEKTAVLADFLKNADKKELPRIVILVRGEVSPDYEELELGIGKQLVIKAIAQASGANEVEVNKAWKDVGDIGEVAERFIKHKKQSTLFSRRLTVQDVYEDLRKLPEITGKGAIDRKLALLRKLLISADSLSSKYIIRTVLSDLRIGVGTGVLRDAIAKAFDRDKSMVEQAYNTTTDFSEVVELASQGKLASAGISIDKPIRVMLYQKVKDIEEGFERVGKPAAIEYKYDGFHCMIHKDGRRIVLFTRRLDNITAQFPEIVKVAKTNIKAKQAIVEVEIIGLDKSTGLWLPFQSISQRIKRKYDIERVAIEFPVQACAFDLLYLNGKSLLSSPHKDRYAALKKILTKSKGKLELAKQLVTGDLDKAEEFYQEALSMGNEGVIMKKMDAEYKPGSRVGFGVKIKPVMEPLDLVIVGGEYGTGKRAGWISSFVLACRKGDEFLRIGKVGTGIKEKEEMGVSFKELTKLMKKDIVSSKDREVVVKPKIILEVAYEEIQKSPTYNSGYALRFPRLLRLRDDKSLDEVDDLKRVERLYDAQRGRK